MSDYVYASTDEEKPIKPLPNISSVGQEKYEKLKSNRSKLIKRRQIRNNFSCEGHFLKNCAVSSMPGRRLKMEDKFKFFSYQNFNFYVVFDGHGGDLGVKLACENVERIVVEEIKSHTCNLNFEEIFKNSFKNLDNFLYENLDGNRANDGTTISCFCHDTKNQIIHLAWLGDSKIIIFNEKSQLLYETIDHKPNLKCEEEYILNLGGFVRKNRVLGSLAVSRALGDFRLKKCEPKGVNRSEYHDSNDPYTQMYNQDFVRVQPDYEFFKINELKNDSNSEKLNIVIASDGLWSVHNCHNSENYSEHKYKNVINCVNYTLYPKIFKIKSKNSKIRSDEENLLKASKRLCLNAFDRGSRDNICCVLVTS